MANLILVESRFEDLIYERDKSAGTAKLVQKIVYRKRNSPGVICYVHDGETRKVITQVDGEECLILGKKVI